MRLPTRRGAAVVVTDAMRVLAGRTRYEVVPMRGIEQALADLPAGATVTVTCSPAKGIPATLDVAAQLVEHGHRVVPHLSARAVENRDHVGRVARWLTANRVREVFVIAGDGERPRGPYADSLSFLRDLLTEADLTAVGVPGYPDAHPFIGHGELRVLLHAKQALLADAGVAGSVTTQMCLDPSRIPRWLAEERAHGLVMPVEMGVPGVVDRAKLMTTGVRLGVGTSLRFLRKNRTAVLSMLAPGGYDPTELVAGAAEHAERLGIRGLHSFTFNRVAATEAWRQLLLAAPSRTS